jgi:hypothetical protein
VDVVPKTFLETEEMQSSALLMEDFAEDRPVIAGWEENRPAGTGGEPMSSTAIGSGAVVACEGENTAQVNESSQSHARDEEGNLAAANGEEIVSAATENRPVDADGMPGMSENADGTLAATDVRVEGDGKVVEMQENGFLGEEYKSIGLQNEDPVTVVLGTAEGRPTCRGSKGGKMMDRPAGAENGGNRSARIDSNGYRPVGVWSNKNSSSKTDSMDNSLLITANMENSSVVIGSKGNRPEGKEGQEETLIENGMKENKAVVTDSNCSSPLLNGSDGEVCVLSDTEESWLSGIRDEEKRPQMPHIGEDKSGVTDTNGNVELRLVEEIRPMETTLKENGHVKTDAKEYSHAETGMKEDRIVETSMKEERQTVAKNEYCSPVWTDNKENSVLNERSVLLDGQGNSNLASKDNESEAEETESVDKSPALEGCAEDSPLETDRKDDIPVLTDGDESSSLVMQNMENNSVVIDTVDERSAGAESEENFSVGTVSIENSSVLSCDKGTNPAATEDIPGATSEEHSDVANTNEESITMVTRSKTGNAESTVAGADKEGNLAICQGDRPVMCKSFSTRSEESKESLNVTGNRPVERGTGTAETERSPEGSSEEAGVTPKPSVDLACLQMPEDAFMVAVPQRQDLHSDSDEEDFLLNLPELELLQQGGTVFQPATGALLTASDAFFPFRCWGPTSHLATIGEDEEDDVTNQG